MGCTFCKIIDDSISNMFNNYYEKYSKEMYYSNFESIHRRLFNFYYHVNRKQLTNPNYINALLKQYNFNSEYLFLKIDEKYGPEPENYYEHIYNIYIAQRIKNIYLTYKPERIKNEGIAFIDILMKNNVGHEIELIQEIVEKYGPEINNVQFPLQFIDCDLNQHNDHIVKEQNDNLPATTETSIIELRLSPKASNIYSEIDRVIEQIDSVDRDLNDEIIELDCTTLKYNDIEFPHLDIISTLEIQNNTHEEQPHHEDEEAIPSGWDIVDI
tara:strand:- start:817 stop:1626 length:810 start_codon:yes stop_codon:yes gene_type:complete